METLKNYVYLKKKTRNWASVLCMLMRNPVYLSIKAGSYSVAFG